MKPQRTGEIIKPSSTLKLFSIEQEQQRWKMSRIWVTEITWVPCLCLWRKTRWDNGMTGQKVLLRSVYLLCPLSTAFPTKEPHVIVPQKICAMVTSFKPSDQRDGMAVPHRAFMKCRAAHMVAVCHATLFQQQVYRRIINPMWSCWQWKDSMAVAAYLGQRPACPLQLETL